MAKTFSYTLGFRAKVVDLVRNFNDLEVDEYVSFLSFAFVAMVYMRVLINWYESQVLMEALFFVESFYFQLANTASTMGTFVEPKLKI